MKIGPFQPAYLLTGRYVIPCTIAAMAIAIPALTSPAAEVPFTTRNIIASSFTRAESVVLADIDGDGKPDAVAAASLAGTIAWWKNIDDSGTNWIMNVIDGSFASANSVAVYDIDGDGKPDVIGAAGGSTDQVAWWRNVDGSGTNWVKFVVDASFDGARSVSIVDINKDGKPDILAAAQTAGTVAWYRNVDGSGTNWVKHTIATGFTGATAAQGADLDRDGNVDVIGAASTINTIAWWRNVDGTGTNWTYHLVDGTFSNAQSVTAADLNGDGHLDLIGAGNFNPGRIAWWQNLNGLGTTWTSRTVAASFNGAFFVLAADLDMDGDVDILGAAQTADDVTWFENTGKGTNWIIRTVDGLFDGARSLAVGDIDGDGDPDIIAAAFIENRLAWWENRTIHRSASFCSVDVTANTFKGAQSVMAIDLDQDGDIDIIAASSTGNRISWWENADGIGGTWLERQIATNVPAASSVQAVDINGDGKPDILGASRSTHTIAWWKDADGSGQNWIRNIITTNFSLVQATAAADLNGNGKQDVAGVSFGTGEIRCWLNADGSGTNWVSHLVATNFSGADAIVLVDVNRDGKLDIVASAFSLGQIAWWENVDGSATNWVKHVIETSFNGVISIQAVDMDRDGDIDIIGSSLVLGQIAWWENVDGTGTNWVMHMVDATVEGAATILAVDIDADGDVDIFGMTSSGIRFSWWENVDGSNTNWRRHALAQSSLDAAAIAVADINGNGKLDLLGAAFVDEDIVSPNIFWWKNQGGQFALTGTNTLPATVTPSSTTAVQKLTFKHLGREDDSDIELQTLAIRFSKLDGTPLTSTEASNLVQSISLYRDDGSGVFEAGSDSLVVHIPTLSIVSGVQIITITNHTPLAQRSVGGSNTYFIVASISPTAGTHLLHQFRVTLLDDQSTARDLSAGIPLSRSCTTGTVTGSSTLITQVDLSIGSIATPNPLELDSNLVFTVTITNSGPNTAFDVVINDVLPVTAIFNSAGSSPECVMTGGMIVCHIGTVTGSQVRIMTLAVKVQGTAIGAITNVATVTTSSTDTNPSNNVTLTVVFLPDTDMDGVADFADPDDDGDGMPDWWELLHGFNRTNSADAAMDADNDGFTNLQEYIADTNPHDDQSYFVVESVDTSGTIMVMALSSPDRVYTLQYSEDAASGVWTNVPGQVNIPGNGGILVLFDISPTESRVYRLLVKLP